MPSVPSVPILPYATHPIPSSPPPSPTSPTSPTSPLPTPPFCVQYNEEFLMIDNHSNMFVVVCNRSGVVFVVLVVNSNLVCQTVASHDGRFPNPQTFEPQPLALTLRPDPKPLTSDVPDHCQYGGSAYVPRRLGLPAALQGYSGRRESLRARLLRGKPTS